MSSDEGVQLRCKSTEGGEHFVYYKSIVLPASVFSPVVDETNARKTVYLTCSLNHTFPYEVS